MELGLLLILATGAGLGARRLGLPAVLGYLAVAVAVSPFVLLARELVAGSVFAAVLAAVVLSIALPTTLVRLGPRPARTGPKTSRA